MDREHPMKPRVLVLEDDPVSRAFFEEVLAALPVAVDAVGRCDDALARAGTGGHALWLLDVQLPDGDALALLPRLRALDREAVALAHTASRDPALHAALLAAGCAEVLPKPVAAGRLLDTVGRFLRVQVREARAAFATAGMPARSASGAGTVAWDDAGALSALGGDPAHVAALRALFVAELPGAVRTVEASVSAGDAVGARAALHRLASACALTGAQALGDAVRRLHAAPGDDDALVAFLRAAGTLPS